MTTTRVRPTFVLFLVITCVALPPVASEAGKAGLHPDQASFERQSRATAARQQLQSGDPVLMAWGAFDATTYRLVEVAPALAAALEKSPNVGAEVDRSALILVLLDAVVQLDVSVPAATLKQYLSKWPVQTLAAMAKASGDRDAIVLDLLSSARGDAWFGLANLLVDHKTPGFAERLLSPLRLRLTISVSDETREARLGEGGGGWMGVADGIGVRPKGFPPVAWYRFEGLRSGVTVLSTGPHPVHYSRVVHDTNQFGESSVESGGPTDPDRATYAQWLIDRNRPPLTVDRRDYLTWANPGDFVTRASAMRARVAFEYRFLVDELTRGGHLSPDEARLVGKPNLEVRVEDRRVTASPPLMVLPLFP